MGCREAWRPLHVSNANAGEHDQKSSPVFPFFQGHILRLPCFSLAASLYPSPMAATLTFKAIEKLYDSEWVLLADLQEDKYERIKRAKVLWHSPDKDEVSRKA